MGDYGLVKGYLALVGAVLVVAGLLGFISNPIAGAGANGDGSGVLLATNSIHNIVHLATGALALYIAFGLSGAAQLQGLLAFGVVYVVIFLAVLLSPTLFGLFNPVPANVPIHVLHAALVVTGLGVWYMARGSTATAYTR
ncbi:hypothetical protein BH18CHL1_BH18CHL1_02880 [soil metagenome]